MKLLTSQNTMLYKGIWVVTIITFKKVKISNSKKMQVPPMDSIRIKGEKSFSLSSVLFI
jgi:hypothetical protein